MSCNLKSEAEYKAKYIGLLRKRGDAHLVPGIIADFQAKHAPQIALPREYVFCEDLSIFVKRLEKPENGGLVNLGNLIKAIHSAYFSPPLDSLPSLTAVSTATFVSCGAFWFPRQDQHKMLDMALEFNEPSTIAQLIGSEARFFQRGSNSVADWLIGLAFAEMKADYLHTGLNEFHGPLCALAENCFAFWQLDGEFIVCAKPELSLDFRYRLHSDTGLAVQFPSGNGFHALRGVKVDDRYLTQPVTGKDLLNERNAQVRMVLLEKYGAKMLDDLPHKVVSKKDDGRKWLNFESSWIRLIEMTWDGYEKIRMLHLKWKDKDGKRHETLIHVPATAREFQRLGQKPPDDIDDCEEMRRWVMRLNPEDMLVKET